jgi:NhaP-type Na+/H+ or K+/H+ antiporter
LKDLSGKVWFVCKLESTQRDPTECAGFCKWYGYCNSRKFFGGSIDRAIIWYLIVGGLLISMGLLESLLQRLPLSPAMFYLPVGYLLGPAGAGFVDFHAAPHAPVLLHIAEAALLISLFTVGLKLRVPLKDRLWWLPLRLGVVAMAITVGMLTLLGTAWLGFPLGVAILLAAILAPTDPILAADVQVRNVGDRDRIRFALSGEGGLNDATALPFMMAGLALMSVPQAQAWKGSGAILHAAWGFVAGAGSGWLLGDVVGRLVVYLRKRYRSALGMEEFLTLGLIALSFGAADLIGGNGFIAVFITGVAVRNIEARNSGDRPASEIMSQIDGAGNEKLATDPRTASAYMTQEVLGFNQQLEHIAEFTMVLLAGMLLSSTGFAVEGVVLAALLFVVVRPVAIGIALLGATRTPLQQGLLTWFGIRGIGSLYYLLYALQYPWSAGAAARLEPIVLTVIASSVLVHGISATPLMNLYQRRKRRRSPDGREFEVQDP